MTGGEPTCALERVTPLALPCLGLQESSVRTVAELDPCLLKVLRDAEVRRASSAAVGNCYNNCCFCCYRPHKDEIFIRLMSKL